MAMMAVAGAATAWGWVGEEAGWAVEEGVKKGEEGEEGWAGEEGAVAGAGTAWGWSVPAVTEALLGARCTWRHARPRGRG